MYAPQNEYAATLDRQGIDDALYLSQGFAGMKLRFQIVALQQFQVGDRFETDDLVATRGVDHQIAGDGEEICAPGRNILPVFRSISSCQNFGDHVLQFVGGRQDAPQATPKGRFLWQDDSLEPVQFGANPVHVDPRF